MLRCLHSQGFLLTHFRDIRTARGPDGPSCPSAAAWLKPVCVRIQTCAGTAGMGALEHSGEMGKCWGAGLKGLDLLVVWAVRAPPAQMC